MRKYTLLIIGALLISSTVFGAPTAKVTFLKGKATFDGKPIKNGDLISKNGVLELKKRSVIRVFIESWGNTITLGPKAKMDLNLDKPSEPKKYTLLRGACRWVTKKKPKGKKKGAIYTRQVSMGVRGTDFYLKANDLLGESEIVVLDGAVQFTNIKNSKDSSLIKKGQWGGIGGRYGKSIGEVLNLPKTVTNQFNKYLKIKE